MLNKNKSKSEGRLGNLLVYMKKYSFALVVAFIFAIGGSVITVISPDKLSEVTDLITQGIVTGINIEKISSICLLLAGLYGLSIILSYLQGFIMATVTQKTTKELRSDISNKINKLPLKYFDKTTVGDVLSRMTNDVDTIGQTLNQSVGTLVSGISLLLGSLYMMTTTNVTMTITAVVATVIGFGLMMLIISKSQKYFINQQRYLGEINGHIEEAYTGHSVIKVYNAGEETNKEFKTLNDSLRQSAWKSQFISGLMMPLMSFIGNFGYVAVCVVGAVLAFNDKISFGVIVAFMMYIRFFTQPLAQFAQAATSLQSTSAACKRVFEFLEEEEMEEESNKDISLENVKGHVKFENVKFGYDEDKLIIKNFSADIKPGQKVAIVGPTGAGKTTLVNLLMKFYDVNSGTIKIDGVPIQTLSREKVHDLFCMVLQDTWLFEGTIRENISYNKGDASESVIISACKAVGIDHFIRTLPEGYDTILDDNTNLSAGQKQLITIARAMVKNAPLLILDEATSSVDTRTELLIQEAMDKLTVGKTSFVIAHRLSTIKNADVILVMKDGDIIESGNHEELLSVNGFYAELYNSQFEKAS
ncbi:ABC transporter ATP-binding protein [Terrisporobacter mayombei]|uniref:ABC transporter ATP-binding protein n=1 Tax=Terrisporobacter mayombei TaxID=1541 RepID=A0ABY9PYU6_9FIRM|nr:ABC transporter ATP-binding protein [Terrisporobacter mayombei]MCC3868287.1 ABC transporter ATP-binding protein/permease [Terrisporobacter mayombei]WMT80428.1 putative ABC transporter ATP-binding protein [Terrisporobacter mayombei]